MFFILRYKPIELCILKNPNKLTIVEKCIYCLKYSRIENNYKIGKTKLFLRYWHIDILNQISKKFKNQIIITQKSKF